MQTYTTEYTLLQEKVELYKQIELLSEQMITANVDDFIDCYEERGSLLEKVSKIDVEIAEFLVTNKLLKDVLNIECSRLDLDDDHKKMYDLSFKIKGAINRILRNDASVQENMRFQKEKLLKDIENLNKSPQTVAGKYNKAVQTSQTSPNLSRNSRFI